MDKNTRLYYKSAINLKLNPVQLEDLVVGFQIKLGSHRYFFRGGETPFNPSSSASIATNKYCMNKRLEALGFPTPKANAFCYKQFENTTTEALIGDLCFPLVVKPMKGTSSGEGVFCNITNHDQLKSYMEKCYQKYPFLSVEEFHGGLITYRVLIFFNKVIGVCERISARIIGDGIHTIGALIDRYNTAREEMDDDAAPGYTVALGPIIIDEEIQARLSELQLTLDSIPQNNETVVLCYTCNSSRGGEINSLGNQICKENAQMLCSAATHLGLNIVGFDVACENILIPIDKSRGFIIEANHDPDIVIHEHPMSGIQTLVSRKIVRRLILKHPLAYLHELCQNKVVSFYIRIIVFISSLMTFWQIFNTLVV
ncbi:MAG: UDP-N-acetylmuramyl peptide synthase [Legionella sp.]|nr:UDP-N-acetylmuramyl peptide synthase [Legionella sp.]